MFTTEQLLAAANRKIDELRIEVPGSSRAGRYVTTRTFQFYRAQKLIDPPNEMRGTAGLYTERHLAQLLAVKALQAQWVPLPEIRRQLADASDEALNKIPTGDAGPVKRSTKPTTETKPETPRTWVQFDLHALVMVLVDARFLQSATSPTLRSLGQDLAAQLLAIRG